MVNLTKNPTVLLLALAILALCMPLSAEPLRITIGYLPEEPNSTNNSLRLSRDDIAQTGQANVLDVFRQIPGVHVDQAGTAGAVASVYIRGADPNFTVVLVDGVRVNDPTNSRGGSFDFSSLAVDEIETIELSPGSLSAIYGSDALGGVISITTRPTQGGGRLRLEAGSASYGVASAGIASITDATEVGMSVHHNNDGQAITGQRGRRDVVSAFYRQRLLSDHYVDIQTRYSENNSQSFPDDSGGQRLAVLDGRDERDSRATTFSLRYEYRPQRHWQFFSSYNYFQQDEDFDSPGVAPGLRDPFGIPANSFINDYQREQLNFYVRNHASGSLKIVAGAEYSKEQGKSLGNIDFGFFTLPTDFSLLRRNQAAFTELRYALSSSFSVQGALRVDDPEGFATQSNGSLGLSYQWSNADIYLKYSEGFKLPSFFALGHPLVGNPQLRPEESRNTEAGISLYSQDRHTRLSLNLYRNIIKGLIDLQEAPVLQLVNRDRVILQGGEVSLNQRLSSQLQALFFVNYLHADIVDSSEPLRNRPRWRAGSTLTWQPQHSTIVTTSIEHVGSVPDSSIPGGDVRLGAYTRVDTSVKYTLSKQVSLNGAIDNLLNTNYETAAGFRGQPRRFRAGMSLRF